MKPEKSKPCDYRTRETECCYYGWMVVLAASFIRILLYGITYTSGIVYLVILENFGTSKGETAWVSSLILSVMFLVTPFSGMLINRFGWRSVTFTGGLMVSCGLLASSFATNLPTLCLSYGVVAGAGCGISFMPGTIAVPKYFKKKQNLALGLASAGGGLGTFIFPPTITLLNHKYGWRGMFMLLSGISLHVCVLGLLYRPVEQNDENKNVIEKQMVKKRRNSTRVENNFSFCKCWLFHIITLNNFLYAFGASIIFGHLAAYAKFDLGLPDGEAAMVYSVCGITITVAKVGQGLLADLHARLWLFKPMVLYIAFYMLGGVATLCLLLRTGFVGLVMYSVAFGCSYAANGGSLIPAILIDLAGKDQLALTYSFLLAATSVGYISGAPVAGWIYDNLHSYSYSFVLAAFAMILSAFIMILPCRYLKPHSEEEITLDVQAPKDIERMMRNENTEQVQMITVQDTSKEKPKTLSSGVEESQSLL